MENELLEELRSSMPTTPTQNENENENENECESIKTNVQQQTNTTEEKQTMAITTPNRTSRKRSYREMTTITMRNDTEDDDEEEEEEDFDIYDLFDDDFSPIPMKKTRIMVNEQKNDNNNNNNNSKGSHLTVSKMHLGGVCFMNNPIDNNTHSSIENHKNINFNMYVAICCCSYTLFGCGMCL